jgi:hypothetical protein
MTMRSSFWVMSALVLGTLSAAAAACSSNSAMGTGGSTGTTTTGTTGTTTTGTTGSGTGGNSQTPPQGEANVKAWLAEGYYKSWTCQPAEHPAVAPSPHSFNRICSNAIISGGSPPFAVGAAAVKELYSDAADAGGTVFGYAVYLKTAADTAADGGSGANWYWYEDNPTLDPPGGVVADGLGTSGNPLTICVGCHSKAGSDANHPGAGDFVYTQVQ